MIFGMGTFAAIKTEDVSCYNFSVWLLNGKSLATGL